MKMKIREKLTKIQTELKAPKSQYNNFGKYKYRSLEDIMEALKPLLKEVRACLVVEDDVKMVGDRVYIVAKATLLDSDSDDSISAQAMARESLQKKGMDESQITGTASSYARKYCLNGLFAIDDTKDADSMDNSQDNRPTASKATDDDKKRIWNEFVSHCRTQEVDPMEFLSWIGVDMDDKNKVHNTVNKFLRSGQQFTDQLLTYKHSDTHN
jgi:hypothetical protein